MYMYKGCGYIIKIFLFKNVKLMFELINNLIKNNEIRI